MRFGKHDSLSKLAKRLEDDVYYDIRDVGWEHVWWEDVAYYLDIKDAFEPAIKLEHLISERGPLVGASLWNKPDKQSPWCIKLWVGGYNGDDPDFVGYGNNLWDALSDALEEVEG